MTATTHSAHTTVVHTHTHTHHQLQHGSAVLEHQPRRSTSRANPARTHGHLTSEPMAAVKKSSAQAVPPLPQQGSEKGAGQLTPAWLAASVGKFAQDPKNRLAQNVVTRTDVMEAAVSRDAFVSANHHFSVSIREQHGVEGLATSQQASGRCWLFAMLNTLRFPMMKRLGLPHDFELSQNYLFFWDKIERSNFFLETMIETASEPYDGRLVQWLLSQPVSDGGQWDMAVSPPAMPSPPCPAGHI
jgi:hypothetical protein